MVAKMILPLLGGSPSVWNTCQLFFQAALLLGYGYSHLTTSWWGTRRQAVIHSIVLLLPIAFLPITIAKGWLPLGEANPIPWLLGLLVISVGLPFFVISTTAPLVQKWFADTDSPASLDPYFLYTASNIGSVLGLLFYPVFIEPNFSLTRQSLLWTISYGLLVLLVIGCAVCLWRSPFEGKREKAKGKSEGEETNSLTYNSSILNPGFYVPPTIQQKAQWVLLSFIPSSLLLGVTTYITTDIAAIPLLWAVPLAIYLFTFILAFSRKPLLPSNSLAGLLPLLLTALVVLSLLKVMQPVWVLLPLHLVGFFVAASVFHGELAQNRPSADYLTSFYFWLGVGGVLGGLFNAIAAPLLFPSVLEYPLIMVLSIVLVRTPSPNLDESSIFNLKQTLPISIGILLGSLLVGMQFRTFNNNLLGSIFALGILIGVRYAFKLHPIRFGVGIASIVLLSLFYIPSMGRLLDTERNFFGVNRVFYDRRGNYHTLLHGTTVHGKQSLDPQRRTEPLTYFHPSGPIGQVFKSFNNTQRLSNVAVMGLGIGTLAAYSEPGQQWTFYEIDPTVEKLARDTRYFTFLQDSKAAVSVVLGDARLRLMDVPENTYDALVMDAFSSDSIPVHLVTQEAIQLYLSKLNKQGLLIINISNRYINLEPVLGALARNLGLSTLRQLELDVSASEKEMGKSASHWVLLARDRSDFGNLINDPRWQTIPENLDAPLWTDDFSNIFGVLRALK